MAPQISSVSSMCALQMGPKEGGAHFALTSNAYMKENCDLKKYSHAQSSHFNNLSTCRQALESGLKHCMLPGPCHRILYVQHRDDFTAAFT